MRADGDPRPIDQIRLDLYHHLLRGVPLPDAVRHPITDSPPDLPAEGPQDGAPGGRTTGTHGPADLAPQDVIALVERLIARALSDTADERLTALLDRARADGRLDGLGQLIGLAAQTMRDALSGLVDTWCRATGGNPAQHGHHGYRPPATGRDAAPHPAPPPHLHTPIRDMRS